MSLIQVLETARRLKEADHKLVLLDLLMSELPSEVILSVEDVMNALEFLSCIGEQIRERAVTPSARFPSPLIDIILDVSVTY